MPDPFSSIPPEILEALQRGDMVGAVKLMRKRGIGLKEAKDILDAIKRSITTAAATVGTATSLPAKPATEAPAKRGAKVDTVPTLEGGAEQGMRAANEEIAAGRQPRKARADGLAPGEVPRERIGPRLVAIAAVVAVAAYYFLVAN
ncbi:MAG: hypothetical protein ABI831_02555 [Betaproteobacteria bacterium]